MQTTKRLYYLPRVRTSQSNIPLSDAIDGFMLACRARKLSPHTIADYSRTLKRFLAHVGDMPMRDVTTVQVSAFLASQPFSEKTVHNYWIGLAALWTWAIREGHVQKHIVRIVEKPKPRKVVIVPFTQEQVKAMLAQDGRTADRNRCVILLLVDTGLRASELCGLSFGDIDLVNRRVKVLGKGNKERLLPFSKRTAQALFKYLSDQDGKEKPFEFTRTSLAHLMQRIGRKAGVADAHPHRFRHTFAVTYLRNGGDPYTLQTILGHSTMEQVRAYLALAQVDLETAHQRASPVENWQL